MSTTISVSCENQVLKLVVNPVLASGGISEDTVEFSFCGLWDGFLKTAVFYRNPSEVYHVLLDENNKAVIPQEVLKEDGILYLGVFGCKDGSTRTSTILKYQVVLGALTEGTTPPAPTPSIYEQILSLSQEMVETAENLTTAEENFEAEVRQRLSSVYTYKGSVNTFADLPDNSTVGDVYNVLSNDINYAWTGVLWDALGGTFDVSQYYTKTETDTALALKANASTTYNKTEVDSALSVKANSTDVYTKTETDAKFTHKPNIFSGTSAPTIDIGENDDLYIKYTEVI